MGPVTFWAVFVLIAAGGGLQVLLGSFLLLAAWRDRAELTRRERGAVAAVGAFALCLATVSAAVLRELWRL